MNKNICMSPLKIKSKILNSGYTPVNYAISTASYPLPPLLIKGPYTPTKTALIESTLTVNIK